MDPKIAKCIVNAAVEALAPHVIYIDNEDTESVKEVRKEAKIRFSAGLELKQLYYRPPLKELQLNLL